MSGIVVRTHEESWCSYWTGRCCRASSNDITYFGSLKSTEAHTCVTFVRQNGKHVGVRGDGVICGYLHTPRSTVLLEKLSGFQPVKKFPTFYETRRFITAFTSAHHPSLSLVSSIQSIPLHPTFWSSILILSSHLSLGLPSGVFPLGFHIRTRIHLSSPLYLLHVPPISLFSTSYPKNIRWGVQIIRLIWSTILIYAWS